MVGYNKVFVKGNKMNLLTISWESVGKDKGYLGDVMDKSQLVSFKDDYVTPGDYINTWNMAEGDWGQVYYYVDQPSWDYQDEQTGEWVRYSDTWMDPDFVPVNPEMMSGSSFWLFHEGEDIEALSFAGQVSLSGTSYTLKGGKMNLCGNPYASLLNLADKNQVKITGMTSFHDDYVTPGDYINTWDLTTADWGQVYYYVNQPTWDYQDEQTGEWVRYSDTWMDPDFVPTSTAIQAGAGFWYYAVENGVTFAFEQLVK